MELIWIPIAVFAALMQAVRTAGQKTLNASMSTMGTTYVRSAVGLPIMICYLAGVLLYTGGGAPEFTWRYLGHAGAGALSQVLATALLIQMFRLRNFAIGTMLTKSDLILTALIGTAFFSEKLSGRGWLALLVVLGGMVIMLAGKFVSLGHNVSGGRSEHSAGHVGAATKRGMAAGGFSKLLFSRTTLIASACALMFSFSFLFLREAILDLGDRPALWRAAWTVVVATGMQAVGLGLWLWVTERRVFSQIWPNRRVIGFIGLTSALGSIGWYTAFALENASYVRAVGQVEAVFTLLLSWAYFKERITRLEFTGIAITVVGVVMFRLL